ncbi:hypothetical protein DAPPUDRAFT_125523, partial [Daphnia pulex]
ASVADLQGSLAREQASLREAAASRAKLESLLQEQQAAAKAASALRYRLRVCGCVHFSSTSVPLFSGRQQRQPAARVQGVAQVAEAGLSVSVPQYIRGSSALYSFTSMVDEQRIQLKPTNSADAGCWASCPAEETMMLCLSIVASAAAAAVPAADKLAAAEAQAAELQKQLEAAQAAAAAAQAEADAAKQQLQQLQQEQQQQVRGWHSYDSISRIERCWEAGCICASCLLQAIEAWQSSCSARCHLA